MTSSERPSIPPSASPSGAGRRSPHWLAVRKPLNPRANFAVGLLAFALPLLLWSLISYVPFIWHPLVLVEDPGDTSVSG